MTRETMRAAVIAGLDELKDDELTALWSFMQTIRGKERHYDPALDPLLKGLFSSSPDLGEQASDILRAEFGKRRDE